MFRFTSLLILLPAILGTAPARADRRSFVFVYEPRTMPRGEIELEWYMTANITYDRVAASHDWSWAHQVEAEYGVTDRIDVAMYQMFSSSAWLGYKLRGRWRPVDTGVWPIDPLLYLELIQRASGDIALEQKVVLGRSFGKLILALDSTVEEGPLGRDVGLKITEGLGVGYELWPWLTLGLEQQLRLAWERKSVYTASSPVLEFGGTSYYLGPTLSLATGRFFWDVNFSARAAGPDDQPRFLFRVLWGVLL